MTSCSLPDSAGAAFALCVFTYQSTTGALRKRKSQEREAVTKPLVPGHVISPELAKNSALNISASGQDRIIGIEFNLSPEKNTLKTRQ